MKIGNVLRSFIGGFAALWALEPCTGNDIIAVKNPYKGMAEFADVAASIPNFLIFAKGGDANYRISDWRVALDFELNENHTLEWKYRELALRSHRKCILYPAYWSGDEHHYPEIMIMQDNRLLSRACDEIREVTAADYWRTNNYIFKNYYELFKRFHGEEFFPISRISELKQIEETARIRGASIIRRGIHKDQRYNIISTIQSWNGWMLLAVVEDECKEDGNYYSNNSAKDAVLRDWLLEVMQLRLHSSRRNYARNWSEYFPDRPVKDLCEEVPPIADLLKFDAQFFYNHVNDEPWKGLITRAINSRSEPMKSVCAQLLYGSEFVSEINPITGKRIDLHPALGGTPTSGHEIYEEIRLAALELAVSMLLYKE